MNVNVICADHHKVMIVKQAHWEPPRVGTKKPPNPKARWLRWLRVLCCYRFINGLFRFSGF